MSETFFMFQYGFRSPQVKRSYIIITRSSMYELPHELPNDLRLKRNFRNVEYRHILVHSSLPSKNKNLAMAQEN